MPTYEYSCSSCGKRYDKREGFDAPAKQKCQFCNKPTALRVLHAPPVVFKGSGFYKTDSRSTSSTSTESTSSSESPKTATETAKPFPPESTPAATDTPSEAAAAG